MLSKIEDYGKKTHRSNDQNAQLQSQKRKDRDRSIGQKGNLSALKGNQKNAVGGKQKDSVQEETHEAPSHGNNQRGRSGQSSSPAPRSQTQNDGRRPSKGNAPRRSSPSGKKGQSPCKNYLEGNCTNPSFPPVCQNYKTDSGCKFGDKCLFGHTEADSQPSKKSKKSGGKGSVA